MSGEVVDDDGHGLAAMVVVAMRVSDGRSVGWASTDATGGFSIPVVTAGAYRVLLGDPSGTWPLVFVGGATPTDFSALTGDTPVGTIAISSGLPYQASLGTTTLVSVATDGSQGHSSSHGPSISADGRHIAFRSSASNLVAGDTNGVDDVFLRDTTTGATTRVSVATDGTQGNDFPSGAPSISADGRSVAFGSRASNLVAGDTNFYGDVFVHDTATGTTTRVSVATDGAQANYASYSPSISADGRYVAFESNASNLVAGDTNTTVDVFVHDTATGVTTRVSTATDGAQANDYSVDPSISADGGSIAFESQASNLVAGDTNGQGDVFVHDTTTGATTRVSTAADGTQANNYSIQGSISAEGRYIAFYSSASNLVAGDANGEGDVFVHDTATGTTTLVSNATDGTQANDGSDLPSISADGRSIAFRSSASNLVAGDTNGQGDVFVHDTTTGATTRASVATDGTQANDYSIEVSISADGRRTAFSSPASNLVAGDTNSDFDVFVHDRSPT